MARMEIVMSEIFSYKPLLRSGEGLVGEHHLTVALIRLEVPSAVVGDVSSQHVQEPELRPEVHQTVAGGCASQPHDALDAGTDFQQGAEPFCLIGLEGRQLVYHHHVVVEGEAAVLNEPLDVLPVDDVNKSPLIKRRFPLNLAPHRQRPGQALEVVPLPQFGGPCVPRHSERGDDQHLPHQKAVQTQVKEGGEGNDAFSKAAIEEDGGGGVHQEEIGRIGLVFMRTVFH